MKISILLMCSILITACGRSTKSDSKKDLGVNDIQSLSQAEVDIACGRGVFNKDLQAGSWDSDILKDSNPPKFGVSLTFENDRDLQIGFYCLTQETRNSAEYSAEYVPANYELQGNQLFITNHTDITILNDIGEKVCSMTSLNGVMLIGTYGSKCIYLEAKNEKLYFKQVR